MIWATESYPLLDMLDSLGVGMDKPLVDNEGFPRADIDLYMVRESKLLYLHSSSQHFLFS